MSLPSSRTHRSLPYRPDIDGLRAVAVLSVVAFHAWPRLFPGGFVGVDIFFVISGFLISSIILKEFEGGTFRFGNFFKRRIHRIFPPLIALLISVLALGWIFLFDNELKKLGSHIAGGSGFFANFLLWMESGYFDTSADKKLLLHLWSLGIEEQYYIVWPMFLWLAYRCRLPIFPTTLALCVMSFTANIASLKGDFVATFYSPLTRMWELLSGSLLAFVLLRRIPPSHKSLANESDQKTFLISNALAAFGIALLFVAFMSISKETPFPGWMALLPVSSAACIIGAGPDAWLNKTLLSRRFCVGMGLISYPLYLWHWPLLSLNHILSGGEPKATTSAALVALSLVLAWTTYQYVEKPLRRFDNSAKTMCLVGCLSVVGLVGVRVYESFDTLLPRLAKNFLGISLSLPHNEQTVEPSIMLLGDSHAGHLLAGLQKKLGGAIADYSAHGCIPFYDVDRYESRITPGTCRHLMNSALNHFAMNDAMHTIILSGMGPVYLTGEPFKGRDLPRVRGNGVTLLSAPDLKDHWEIYRRGLIDTLSYLSRHKNKRIIFAIDVPEIGIDPNDCREKSWSILGHKVVTRSPLTLCQIPRSESDARTQRYKDIVYAGLRDFPQVRLFDPTNLFCDTDWCRSFIGGIRMYHDWDHLSLDGSDYVASYLITLIQSDSR